MSEGDAEARDQLARAEGLGEVIVGPVVECAYFVLLVAACGKHDNGHCAPFAQPPRHLEAADAGKAEIEHDDIRRLCGGQRHPFLAGRGLNHAKAVAHQ
jgi:hypothetical protein